MALYLEIIRGKNKGGKFKIYPGVRIGRKTGEIILQEPRASALHARIEVDSNGALFLADQDSTNGFKINGMPMKKGPLELGTLVQIGSTLLRVVATSPVEETQVSVQPLDLEWKDLLLKALDSLSLQTAPPTEMPLAFVPALQLTYIEGPQTDKTLVLGYGPRRAGADGLDIEIQEEGAPPFAFELFSDPSGQAHLRTTFPTLVQVNGRSLKETALCLGDVIKIGKTSIRIDEAKSGT